MSTPTAQHSPRIAALLEKTRAARGRLVFALDATASREAMWDMAASLQASMFEEAAKIGGLDMQLLFYLGDEVSLSPWISDAHELVQRMHVVRCKSGATQIAKVLRHIWTENQRRKVDAAVFIGDAVEEAPAELYTAAANLGVPLFCFQEGNNLALHVDEHGEFVQEHPPIKVELIFREIAQRSGGAYGRFAPGAAKQLGEMLRAVVAFATGGVAALTNQRTDSARLLLSQLK